MNSLVRRAQQVGYFENLLARCGMMGDDDLPQIVGKTPVARQPAAGFLVVNP